MNKQQIKNKKILKKIIFGGYTAAAPGPAGGVPRNIFVSL